MPPDLLPADPADPRVAALRARASSGALDPARLPLVHGDQVLASRAQRAMVWLCRVAGPTVYNLPSAVRLRGPLDVNALRAALQGVTERQESLRTVFPTVDGRLRPTVLPRFEAALPELPVVDLDEAVRRAADPVAFDFVSQPPWSATLYTLGENDHVLAFVHHHLVWDGWSIGLLIAEIAVRYTAAIQGRPADLPALSTTYADYARWEHTWWTADLAASHADWWRTTLNRTRDLTLPWDRARPEVPTWRGGTAPLVLPVGRLKERCAERGATLFMGLLSAFVAVLHRLGAPADFAVGTPHAHRTKPEFESIIGYFANVLVLGVSIRPDDTWSTLLDRTRSSVLGAFAHADLPFDAVAEAVAPHRRSDRNPVFQVMFALHSEKLDDLELPGLTVTSLAVPNDVTHFELGLHLWHRPPEPGTKGAWASGYLSFARDLLDDETAHRWMHHLGVWLASAVEAPDVPLDTLPLHADDAWFRSGGTPFDERPPQGAVVYTPAALALAASARDSLPPAIVVRGGPLDAATLQRVRGRTDLHYAWRLPESVEDLAVGRARAAGAVVGLGSPDRSRVRVVDRRGHDAPIGVVGAVVVDGEVTPQHGAWRPDGALAPADGPERVVVEGAWLDLVAAEARIARAARLSAARLSRFAGPDGWRWRVLAVPDRALDRVAVQAAARDVVGACPVDVVFVNRADEAARDLPALSPASLPPDVAAAPAPELGERRRWHLDDLGPSTFVHPPQTTDRRADPTHGAATGVPAWTDGGPIPVDATAPTTLVEALLRAAATPNGLVTYREGTPDRMSYAELVTRAERVRGGLAAAGLRPGDRVVLQLERLEDHFVGFWACVLGGMRPVAVARPPRFDSHNAVRSKLWNAWGLLGRPVVLTERATAAALAASAPEPGARVVVIDGLPDPTGEVFRPTPDDVVFYQLTSGSTGIPKCIPETHRAVLTHVRGATLVNGYGPTDRSVNWLPLDHVVPTLTSHLRDVVLGIEQVHAEPAWVLADPLRWLDLLHDHAATLSWSPNFGFKLVADALTAPGRRRGWDLSRVRLVMNAGEQVTLPVVSAFLDATAPYGFPEAAMQPAYGMAEVATAVTFTTGFRRDRAVVRVGSASLDRVLTVVPDDAPGISFIDLGGPNPGVALRIADAAGRVVPERMIGQIQMRGAVVHPGYVDHPEANREAFVGDGWFDSGDLGFLHEGHLFVTGRKKEIIIVRGANFYCYEVEDVVSAVDGVAPTFAAVTAVEDPTTGSESLAVFFATRASGAEVETLRRVREAVTREFGVVPAVILPVAREEIPKTTSGKIQRLELRERLRSGAFERRVREVDLALANARTLPDTFFVPSWQDAPARTTDVEIPWRILRDVRGVSSLAASHGPTLVVVRPGAGRAARAAWGSAALERPGLVARVVEVCADEEEAALAVERRTPGPDAAVRWREGRRMAPALEHVRPTVREPFHPRRVLVTGGGGGIGRLLTRSLAQRFGAETITLRRSAAERDGASVAGDVADPQVLRSISGTFDLILHLAGTFPLRMLAEESEASFLDAQHAKVAGLAALVDRWPAAVHVAFGSVYAWLPTVAGAAYAAANGALADACEGMRARGHDVRCFSWGHWEEVGMSTGFPFADQARATGIDLLPASVAVTATWIGLGTGHPDLFIGLDPRAPAVARGITGAPTRGLEVLRLAGPTPRVLDPVDSAGRPIPHRYDVIDPVPRRADGSLDLAALALLGRPEPVAPRTALERALAAAWCEALGVDRVDVDTTFFALGGQSVQLVWVLARLETTLHRKLTAVELFQFPTIRALARHLEEGDAVEHKRLEDAATRGQRLRQARRPPPRAR